MPKDGYTRLTGKMARDPPARREGLRRLAEMRLAKERRGLGVLCGRFARGEGLTESAQESSAREQRAGSGITEQNTVGA
jgi:hypothetical protein